VNKDLYILFEIVQEDTKKKAIKNNILTNLILTLRYFMTLSCMQRGTAANYQGLYQSNICCTRILF